MTKIAIAGDLHIKENVRSRTDDYFNACLSKIDKYLKDNDYLIILGDFFHTPSIQIEYINQIIYSLDKYRGRIFTILGNHDAYYRTLNLDKTAIGLLNNVGIVNLKLDTFLIDGVSFDVASVVPELKLPEKKSDILLGHFYLDNNLAPKESLKLSDLKEYRTVILGHDHAPYNPVVTEMTTIYRNGSSSRVDSQSYNLDRDEIVYVQIDNGVIKLKSIKVSSPESIFTVETLNKPLQKVKCDFKNLENLISNFKVKESNTDMSTLKVLKELETPEECIDYLQVVHESLGLKF